MTAYQGKSSAFYDLIRNGGVRFTARAVWRRYWLDPQLFQKWIKQNEPGGSDMELQKVTSFTYMPKISIICATYNPAKRFLEEMLKSVAAQTYGNWELCVVDGGSKDGNTDQVLESHESGDDRIAVKRLSANLGIAGNFNCAAAMATGDYVVFLDHDDTLAPFALFEIVRCLNSNAKNDLVYSDEDKLDHRRGRRIMPFFKPDFSPDLLRSHNYIGHLVAIRRSLGEDIGWFREDVDGAQDYDLILRAADVADEVKHIPKILYHWRAHPGSTARSPRSKTYTTSAGQRVLQAHLQRQGLPGHVRDGELPNTFRVVYGATQKPKISIIIPNRDQADSLNNCVASLEARSTYSNKEILILENGSQNEETFRLYRRLQHEMSVTVLNWHDRFNVSRVFNFASEYTDGDFLLFLNNDTEAINGDWLERMVEHAQRDEVGAVGAKLHYPHGTIQHAGVIVGLNGTAGHPFRHYPGNHHGYFGRLKVIHNVSAVTGACLMVSRTKCHECGMFDENFPLAFGDVDFCLRLQQHGYVNVFTPYAKLYHHESKTRGYEDTPEKAARFAEESRYFQRKWARFIERGDPYYNPNLTLERGDFRIRPS